jgi:alkylresorcinol/alkylpyrone synthase
VLYPDTENVMGWEIVEGGFKVVLSPRVPEVARAHLGADVDALLGPLELDRSAIRHWIAHTGGPKVLMAFEEALSVPRSALARSWDALRRTGNLSSASVLLVLEDLLASGETRPGDKGVMLAMGPGFVSELVLLEW